MASPTVDRSALRNVTDPDHPCSKRKLPPVNPPREWRRRSKPSSRPGTKRRFPDKIPADVGLIDVRPNVKKAPIEPKNGMKPCQTVFLAWSIYSHLEGRVVATVQDVWLLGARLHIRESDVARARIERVKNVHSWFYGFYAPAGSIVPDEASAIDVRYDPWSVVHPGFYIADSTGNPRMGKDIRDDRFRGAIQFAAVHIWIDPATRTPRTKAYRALRSVDLSQMPSGLVVPSGSATSSALLAAGAGLLLGAGAAHVAKRQGWL